MVFSRKALFHPKYWLLLLLLSIFWVLSRLPYAWQLAIGAKLGPALTKIYKRAKFTVTKNIELCFPQESSATRAKIISESTRELGIAIMETFLVWFRDLNKFFAGRVQVEGEAHFREAVAKENGIILLSCHFGSVDLNAALIASLDRNSKKFVGTYRQTDEVVNDFLKSARGKYCEDLLSSTNQRGIVKELKQGNIILYAPDIEVKGKGAVYANFMGVPAHTTTVISRLAKISGATVLPIAHYRINDKPEYRLKIFPPITEFPSENLEEDTRKVNLAVEQIIEPNPERYWWVIKRFKQQPNGVSPYATK